mgnify:FL=1
MSSKNDTLLANNSELYAISQGNKYDQSRLTVVLDQNIIDDLNNQILAKQRILDNSISNGLLGPIFSAINNIFVNVIDILYELMMWIRNPSQVSLFNVLFTGYRPVSLLIVCILMYYIITTIVRMMNV